MSTPPAQQPAFLGAGHTLLDRSAKPIFVIDMDRTIRTCNVSGHHMLASEPALLHTTGGRLHGSDGQLEQAMARHMATLTPWPDAHAPDQFFPVGAPLRAQWVAVSVSCLRPSAGARSAPQAHHVLLVVHPVVRIRRVEPALLQAALTLTRSEAQVAALIYAGYTLREVAQKIGVGQSTVKTHLHNVFHKNRIRKQTELVHLVASLSSV